MLRDVTRGPEEAALGNGNDEKQRKVDDLDGRDVDLVEPPRAHYEFEGDEEEDGEDVERWLVREYGVGFDSFEGENGSSELDLCCSVGGNIAKCIR